MYRYYLAVILGAPSLLALIAILAGGLAPLFAFLAAYATTALAFGIDALAALSVRYLMPKWAMDARRHFWHVHRCERAIYVRLGIRRWKDKIPEAGGLLVGFSKKHVTDAKSPTYLLHFLSETCYAELMHLISIPLGFAVILAFPAQLAYFGLPVALINALLNLLPILVQRYVRPFLLAQYTRLERKQAKKEAA